MIRLLWRLFATTTPGRLRLTKPAKSSGEPLIEDRTSGVLIEPVTKVELAFNKHVSGSDCKMVSMACMTSGVSCSVAVAYIVCEAVRVAGDTAVIMVWVVKGVFIELITEGEVARDEVVIVVEIISEVTIAEVVVAVAKIIIDGAVTEGAFA